MFDGPVVESEYLEDKPHVEDVSNIYSGALLFLLFINDIVNGIDSNIRLFADDTSLFIIVENVSYAAACLKFDLAKITRWAATGQVTFNPSKTEVLLLSNAQPYKWTMCKSRKLNPTNIWV